MPALQKKTLTLQQQPSDPPSPESAYGVASATGLQRTAGDGGQEARPSEPAVWVEGCLGITASLFFRGDRDGHFLTG